MKAVITAWGFGTRMCPITKVIPKELMPVWTKPVIGYIVEWIAKTKIKDLLIITSQWKQALEDYFDKNYELEDLLKRKNKIDYLKQINEPKEIANIAFIRQKEQLGLAHAIWMAKPWISEEYFLASIWDTIFDPKVFEEAIEIHNRTKNPVIVLQEIPREEVNKYGVVKIEDNKITWIVEKPKIEDAPSNLIISWIYILPKKIFHIIESLSIDEKYGEILFTDALELLWKEYDIIPYITQHKIYDVWNPKDWLKANNELCNF